jgi:hypothetical protein
MGMKRVITTVNEGLYFNIQLQEWDGDEWIDIKPTEHLALMVHLDQLKETIEKMLLG